MRCASGPSCGPGRAKRKSKDDGDEMPILVGVSCEIPEGWPGVGLISVNPRRRPESGALVVLWWTLLGCISPRDGLMPRAVTGVCGAVGEERMVSRFDCAPRVGVSSCSTRDARWLGVWAMVYRGEMVSVVIVLRPDAEGDLPWLGPRCDLEFELSGGETW